MKLFNIGLMTLALLSSASASEARDAFTVASPTAGFNSSQNGGGKDLTTLVQENEGYPNPGGRSRCMLVKRQVTDAYGAFIGYHTFDVCS